MDKEETGIALIGAGRIGSHHARAIAQEVPGARLAAVVDPRTAVANQLAQELGARPYSNANAALGAPDVQAVVVTTPAALHTDIILAAAASGRHVFTEKPITTTLEDADRVIDACHDAGVVLQVGFNRRFVAGFREARATIDSGLIGQIQLMRSLTRDPGPYGGDPHRTPAWTIYLETLIHDFDTLLWLNPRARVVSVNAMADALIRPDAKESGFLDTSLTTLRFDNGAMATAEASFSASYGYDVRGEVFGSGGMVTMGSARTSDMTYFGANGESATTSRADTDLLHTAYVDEFRAFVARIRDEKVQIPTGEDGRRALVVARAAIESVRRSREIAIDNGRLVGAGKEVA